MDIQIQLTDKKSEIPNPSHLGFGSIFTDHMFEMDYTEGVGWHNATIKPYGPMMLDPSFVVLHYGQETFEGLKAYKSANDEVLLFRPEMNARRLNASNKRLCIPEIPEELFLEAVKILVGLDRDWIPSESGTSLYIRPFVFATEPTLMVHPSKKYKFMIILSPVGSYYKEGINPVKIYVESDYVRAAVGGVGFAKTGGNYGASLLAGEEAKAKGYSQVLWLDSKEHKFIEEVGTMNVFFVLKGQLVTPSLSGSILPGITRDSVLMIAKDMGLEVIERRITIEEIFEAHSNHELSEVFGTGTAAVISPVGELCYKDKVIQINHGATGELAKTLYEVITGIQTGQIEDKYEFRQVIE